MSTLEVRISSSADDVEESAAGSVNFTSSDLELVDDASKPDQTIGLRFTALGIPQGAIITKAYIQFQVDEVSSGTAALQIHGVDVDNAAVFANRTFDVSARPTTSATVAWQPPAWTTVGQAGVDQRTADISAIIQEIVNRTGWTANNALALVITGSGQRVAEAFDGAAGAAPLLHIEYQLGPVSAPVAFASPPDTNDAANGLAETAAAGTLVGSTARAVDPDAGDTVGYSINDARFAIDANGVITRSGVGTLDYEAAPTVTVTVTATSSDRSTATQAFTIGLADVDEPVAFASPPDANPAANSILANAAAGTTVGITAAARDPDAGATVSYSLDDARFAIDGNGVITRSATGTLDPLAEPTITLNVTATSSDSSTVTQPFALGVTSVQPTPTVIRFAVFGDYGDTETSGEKAVAALVDSWNVDFILTVGDNAYGSLPFDNAVGQFYSDYIGNYRGSYGPGSTINRFFPTLGNHEYDDSSAGPNGSLSVYLNYFTLPDNERYYDFQAGQVHFFAVNSNSQEPDGATATSVQGQWLRTALASSDAAYNVVYFHHTPYNSSGGSNGMRWPFEAWGADAVFAGHKHNFDRVMRDDNLDGVSLPYITTGLGGAGKTPPSVGASLVTVSDTGMRIDFYTVDGVLKDSYTVAAPPGGNPLFVNGNDVLNGTAASDYLWGLDGNDTLKGLSGNDMLIGGMGDDLFVFATGNGHDTIADFAAGAGTPDRLDLRALGIDTAAEFRQRAFDQGADTVLDLGGGHRITLLGVHVQQFQDADFLV